MALRTSSQTGNWSSTSTWGGAAAPVDGDTVSIGHTVTVDANSTIGTSPNDTTTYVVIVTSGGKLVISNGVTLTCKGNLQLNGGGPVTTPRLEVNGNGKLIFDGSAVSSTRNYILRLEYQNTMKLAGTDANNRATVEAAAASGIWQMSMQGASPHFNNSNWGLIKRCGNATNKSNLGDNYTFEGSQTISITNTVFDDCGYFTISTNSNARTVTLTDWSWINTPAPSSAYCLQITHTSITALVTTINRCSFDRRVLLTNSSYMLVTNSIFLDQAVNNSGSTGLYTGSGNNVFVQSTNTAATWYGSLNQTYCFHNYLDGNNLPTITLVSASASDTIADNIQDFGDTSPGAPDGFFISGNASGRKYAVSRNFFLPDSAGTGSGAWLNLYYSSAGTADIEHNTIIVNGNNQTGTYYGESGGGAAGQLTSFKSNVFWTPTGDANGGGYKLYRHSGSTVQNIASAANCDYNWGWNLAAGTEGNGYFCGNTATAMFSSGTPDVNGGNGNPGFVDTTRNLVRFDTVYLGNAAATAWATSTAYVVGDVVSASDAGYFGGTTINWRCVLAHTSATGNATNGKPGAVSGFRTNWEPMSLYRLREDPTRIPLLLAWVRAGFAVTNASLNNAGHDGVTIGAGVFIASTSIPVMQNHYRQQGLCA